VLNAPEELLVSSTLCPVEVLMIEILASLTTAPLGSVTVPLMLPVLRVVWATRSVEENTTKKPIKASMLNRAPGWENWGFIVLPSFQEFLTKAFLSCVYFLSGNR
jgi:hypothetical protein